MTFSAGFIGIMLAGIGSLILIAAVLACQHVIRWWRGGRERLERTRREAADSTAQFLACHRCRTGSTAFKCTCETDCHTFGCNGLFADLERDLIKGDQ